MKYFVKVLIVFVLAVGVVFGMYYYTNANNTTDNGDTSQLTTVTKAPVTEKGSDDVLLASLDKEDYQLYQQGNAVKLVHDGQETVFDDWSKNIALEAPKMYYADFNDDDKNEIMIRVVNQPNEEDGGYIYDLYLLIPSNNDDGTVSYQVAVASEYTWSKILDDVINEEMSQLDSCKKIIQFAMNTSDIEYDKTTGISTNSYTGFARALKDDNGNYCTADRWIRGTGSYYINDENKICVEVGVNIAYKEISTIQDAGYIYFELSINPDSTNFYVTRRSMVFKANDEYKVASPKKVADKSWSYTQKNINMAEYSTGDSVIDWVKYSFKYDQAVTTNTVNLDSESTEIKNISKIVLTDSYIELTAKKGYTFGDTAKKNDVSVTINEGTKKEYEISYLTSVSKAGDNEVLKITFDKAYPQDAIQTVTVAFPAKQ